MAEIDLTSPGAAFARQARMESRVVAVLTRAVDRFLGDVRHAVETAGLSLSAGVILGAWERRIADALESRQIDEDAREYLYAVIVESSLPTDAYDAARTLLTIAHEESWSASELRTEAREVFAPGARDLGITAAAAPRRPRNGANWAALDAAAGGDWMGKMKRDARTAVTGLDGLLTSQRLAEQGFTRRRWVTRKDDKVRETHAHAEGQTVEMDQPFIVGGYPLRYPGDRQGPPAIVINCRCVQVGVRFRPTRRY